MTTRTPQRDIYSVSRLNAEIRAMLETGFPLVWVAGEISNLAAPRSGHLYFTLKDAHAQVRCALFRNRRRLLRFEPREGDQVLARVRVSLYEARGDFQLIVEHLEPAGEGELLRAFEALKAKLAAEGLFDQARKRPLPPFPRRIGVVTSPTGAAIRDILNVLARRNPGVEVIIYPALVQGEGAAAELAEALRLAEARGECDLLILARGGGSAEDLAAFNDEALARTIAALETPLISAVGHEIDFTIADFVADRRAPTPSAAAELAVPDQAQLRERLALIEQRLMRAIHRRIEALAERLAHAVHKLRLLHPGRRLEQQALRVDELERRLVQALARRIEQTRARLQGLERRLFERSPAQRLVHLEHRLATSRHRLTQSMEQLLERRRQDLARLAAALRAVSPLETLARGYSITTRADDGRVLMDAGQVRPGERIRTRLHRGELTSVVESTSTDSD